MTIEERRKRPERRAHRVGAHETLGEFAANVPGVATFGANGVRDASGNRAPLPAGLFPRIFNLDFPDHVPFLVPLVVVAENHSEYGGRGADTLHRVPFRRRVRGVQPVHASKRVDEQPRNVARSEHVNH